MTATPPPPTLQFHAVPEAAAEAPPHLDVRVGTGRTVEYALDSDEFLIGGAAGCDLRLTGPNLPPVIAQFSKSADGLRVRKLAPTVAVTLNGRPLSGSTAVSVKNGDLVATGTTEIGVRISSTNFITPRFVSVDAIPTDRRQAALDEQTAELESERARWRQQRRELDAELAAASGKVAGREADLARREAAVVAHDAELARVRDELAAVRATLADEYAGKRTELVRMYDSVRSESGTVDQRRQELDAEYARRFAAQEEDFGRRRAEVEEDLTARRAAADAEFANRGRDMETEIARRRLEFDTDSREYEPRFLELAAQRQQLAAAFAELATQRQALDILREQLTADRRSFDGDRAWQVECLGAAEAEVARHDADLMNREEILRTERAAIDADRARYKDDLARLDRWQGELDEKQSTLNGRAAEVDYRVGLLARDAGDLEEQMKLAEAEHARLRTESDRLEQVAAELNAQAAALGERAGQQEAQQAMLAVLRSRLERQEADLRRDAAELVDERRIQDAARAELNAMLAEAERLRADLGSLYANHTEKHQVVSEQHLRMTSTIDDIRRQREELHAADAKLREQELHLDARSAEIAEQAAILKARLTQSLDLHERLEADRAAVRVREAALADADATRQMLQEQLRKRAEELGTRAKAVDEQARTLAEEHAVVATLRAGIDETKTKAVEHVEAERLALAAKAAELQQQAAILASREAALAQQVSRMKEVGTAVAAERKTLFDTRQAWEAERAAAQATDQATRIDTDTLRSRVAEHFAELRRQAPVLDSHASSALEKLTAARDVLRGHLAELHQYAQQTRQVIDAARTQLRMDADQVRQQDADLDAARSEHRLAVAGFRQQLLDWQAKVAELKQSLSQTDTRYEAKEADLAAAAARIDAVAKDLARRSAQIADEQRLIGEKRTEMERHLADMREWYRRKLRELAAGRNIDDSDMPGPAVEPKVAGLVLAASSADVESTDDVHDNADVDPGDQHLGELLRSRGLVDEATLHALWEEAHRQRKTLRQVLLTSGAVTVYQLALIEAGNLDGLVLGRLRVIDRLRTTPRETVYRVYDPTRPNSATRGLCLLRHLAETEMADAVHPDEFRQRFRAAMAASHMNLANTFDVLELNGRPAALQEWVSGLPAADWPAAAATPGVWLKLLTDAARGLNHAHRAGLVHGHLAAESFLLSADGTLKILGIGDPPWLTGGTVALFDPLPANDLRALGQAAFAWCHIGARRRVGRAKPFPTELTAVVRRLETGAESGMGDIVSIDRPYADAAELLRDLVALAESHPCPAETWNKIVRYGAENAPAVPTPLRQSA